MFPSIADPRTWQIIWVAALIALTFVFITYMTIRHRRTEKEKRHELLAVLHKEGEAEPVREGYEGSSIFPSSTKLSFDFMEDGAAINAANALIEEGLVTRIERSRVVRNQREKYFVYRLTKPAGVDHVTTLFGTPPVSLPDEE